MTDKELSNLHVFFLSIREDRHTLSRKGICQTLAALTELEQARARIEELEASLGEWKQRAGRLALKAKPLLGKVAELKAVTEELGKVQLAYEMSEALRGTDEEGTP